MPRRAFGWRLIFAASIFNFCLIISHTDQFAAKTRYSASTMRAFHSIVGGLGEFGFIANPKEEHITELNPVEAGRILLLAVNLIFEFRVCTKASIELFPCKTL
jgi:hypothetical protein